MTISEYWGEVRRLGLTPTNVPTVYLSASGEHHNVPTPDEFSPEQRQKIIARLKLLLGVGI